MAGAATPAAAAGTSVGIENDAGAPGAPGASAPPTETAGDRWIVSPESEKDERRSPCSFGEIALGAAVAGVDGAAAATAGVAAGVAAGGAVGGAGDAASPPLRMKPTLPRFFFFRFDVLTVAEKPLAGAVVENAGVTAGVDGGACATGVDAAAGRGDGRVVFGRAVAGRAVAGRAVVGRAVAPPPPINEKPVGVLGVAAAPPWPPPMKEKPVDAGAAAAAGTAAAAALGGGPAGFGFGRGAVGGAGDFFTRPAGGRAFGASFFLPPNSQLIDK